MLRLASRDLRRRASETLLLLIALAVAASTLTIGLVLQGETTAPYARTRAVTSGPDVIASGFTRIHISDAQLRALKALSDLPAVVAHSGPFPVTWTPLRAGRLTTSAEVEGRDRRRAAVDQPKVLTGGWVRRGQAVIERSFAAALDVGVGDQIRLGGHPFQVAGTAVTAALPPYPQLCTIGCILASPTLRSSQPGLVWLSRPDARLLVSPTGPLTAFVNLRLRDPADAPAFVAHLTQAGSAGTGELVPWQDIRARNAELLRNERVIALFGSSLLAVLALASLVVLVGGRMADEVRRVGALKAVGSTPGFIARVLLTEYLVVAAVAAAIGLLLGRASAPILTSPSAGLLGDAGRPTLRLTDVAVVTGVTLGVTILATVIPALRAARASTVRALADLGRRPRRHRVLISLSAHLPAALLVGVRLVARRPRRAVLSVCTVAVSVCGIVAVMFAKATLEVPGAGVLDPNGQRLSRVLFALTLVLAIVASVNLIFVSASTASDARVSVAVARALGASPGQAAAGLAFAQVIPALVGVLLGLPAGIALFAVLNPKGAQAGPPLWSLALVPVITMLLAATFTALPTRLAARRSVAETLNTETG